MGPKSILLFSTLFIASCAPYLPRYERPTSDTTARLRYVVGMQQGTLEIFDDKHCSKNGAHAIHVRSDFGAALHGVNNKSIGIPDADSTGKRLAGEILIDAEKPLYFAFFGANETYINVLTCRGFSGFHPRKGRDYEISVDGAPCRMRISEITTTQAGSYSRIPVEPIVTSRTDCPAAYDVITGGFR